MASRPMVESQSSRMRDKYCLLSPLAPVCCKRADEELAWPALLQDLVIVFSVELFICERRVCPHRTVPNSVTSAHSSEIASRKH
ncbi:hypothetical protein CIHG_09341 [Coccidioides immitis H538.4]|uniref:Uncharacterized protein n=2 Tax=Coccidioides immitis TaxID=5501 RepID=A0A0J8S3X3_COCIT|nr:hypothetical protein CIRG_02502 [Coccidioides immitis RMSCC 2394]KMU91531.1 hypothetical protein CIHG_09341 [Coccidioides immitis H538.4]